MKILGDNLAHSRCSLNINHVFPLKAYLSVPLTRWSPSCSAKSGLVQLVLGPKVRTDGGESRGIPQLQLHLLPGPGATSMGQVQRWLPVCTLSEKTMLPKLVQEWLPVID